MGYFIFQVNVKRRRKRRQLNRIVERICNSSDSSPDRSVDVSTPVTSLEHNNVHSFISSEDESLGISSIETKSSFDLYSNSSDAENESDPDFIKDVTNVFKEIHITQNDLTKVLKVLNKYHPELPTDARTLLSTDQAKIETRVVAPGEYYHFGLKKGLAFVAKQLKLSETIRLQFNFDGLPIHRSTTKGFWPILCSLSGHSSSIFIVGAYYGDQKPEEPNDYLKDMIEELQDVLQNGFNGLNVEFHCCSCDTPARHFILNVKSHSSYFGCERCTQKGITVDRRRVFPEVNFRKRDNSSFRCRDQLHHHKGSSPFEIIPQIDMVTSFPLDYMHSVCKGVTYKLLEELRSGERERLSVQQLNLMSTLLISLRDDIVSDFSRRPRSMSHLGMWKATELRLFLLYLAPVVLPVFCSVEYLECFNSLTVVMRIFCSHHSRDYFVYARDLLSRVVLQIRDIFGERSLVYNVHSLCHLSDDVEKFGFLDTFSCFQYENFLRFLKRVIRSPKYPLQQLVRRVSELDPSLGRCQQNFAFGIELTNEINPQNLPDLDFHSDMKFFCTLTLNSNSNSCVIKTNSQNRYVFLKGTSFKPFEVSYFARHEENGDVYLVGRFLKVIGSAFMYPLPSEKVGIVKVSHSKRTLPVIIRLSDVGGKGMLLQKKYFTSIVHTQTLFRC